MLGKNLFKTMASVCVMVLAFVFLTSGVLASAAQTAYEPVKPPKIEYFKSSADNIAPGETVILSWRVLGAKEVAITGEEKEIECVLEGSTEVWPLATTIYTLHAYGFKGEEVTSSVTVKVGAAVIKSFTANPGEVAPGESVTLSWDVYNAESVKIKGADDKVYPPSGSLVVKPYATTTYTLEATGLNGIVVSKPLTVKVKGPVIVSFKADKEEVVPGETVVLSWDVLYAKSVSIKGIEKQPEDTTGSIEAWPLVTTTYILEAVGYDGSTVTKEITVNVKSPIITSFKASKITISKGEMVTLSWTTKNAVKCSLETNLGQKIPSVPVNGSIAVTPNKTITFTLVATDEKGNVAKQSVEIVVTN